MRKNEERERGEARTREKEEGDVCRVLKIGFGDLMLLYAHPTSILFLIYPS